MHTTNNPIHAVRIREACFAVMSPRRLNSMKKPDHRMIEVRRRGKAKPTWHLRYGH
jgi:hypothetical protein